MQRARTLSYLVATLLLASCHSNDECPVQCGSMCLPASACAVGLSCPPDSPCDPCSGQCRAQCDASKPCVDTTKTCCAAFCSDTDNDLTNCGACGASCGVDSDACTNGQCGCGGGAPCGGGMMCCGGTCILADAQNCGACGAACDEGEACDLQAGGCRCGSTLKVGASACGPDSACCNGACTPIESDPQNCGHCGGFCGNGILCKNGECDCTTAGCSDTTQTCCNGGCVATSTDKADCGACGVACGLGEICSSAQCTCGSTMHGGGPACASGQTCCPGGCFDLASNASNCGACGKVCDAASTSGCGSGACVCKSGYAPSSNPLICTDINECLTNNGGCSANATCANTPGSRTCTCNSGYSGDGVTCTDVNECLADNGGCGKQKTCNNTVGSFTCSCDVGLQAQGGNCVYEDCGSAWPNIGYFFSPDGTEIHQTICGCIPQTAGAIYGDNSYWGYCTPSSTMCPGNEAASCWTHFTGSLVGDSGAPALGAHGCGSIGWQNIGTFTCTAGKAELQKICDCLPPGYTNTAVWTPVGSCYRRSTGNVGAPWCP